MFIMLKNLDKLVCHMKSCQTHFDVLPVRGTVQTLIILGVCIIFESRPEENSLEILMDEKLSMTWQCALAAQKAKMYKVPPNPNLSLIIQPLLYVLVKLLGSLLLVLCCLGL